MPTRMTTSVPTGGHTARGHSKAHPRSDHSAMATLLATARVATKWTLTGGLIAAAAFTAGWVQRGQVDTHERLYRRAH